MKINVTQGRIHINSVVVVYESDSVVILEMDCRAKRCEIVCYESGDVEALILDAGEHTLYAEKSDEWTRIECELPPGDWVAIADVARYTVRWVLYREQSARVAWTDAAEEGGNGS